MRDFLLQWNINGLTSHLNELKCLVKKVNPLIISLQESHLSPTKNPILKHYDLYRYDYLDGNIACGGVCTFVKNTCFSKQINIVTNLQCIAVQIKLPGLAQQLCVCNVYLPPHLQYSESDLSNIKRQLPVPFVFVGDFNAHNPLWGDSRLDVKGKEVEQFILNHNNVHLLNNGDATHFNLSYLSHSSIDLTFSSSGIFPDLKWNTINDLYFSDHFPITLSYENASVNVPQNSSSSPKIWNYDKANWEMFSSKITFHQKINFDNDETDVDSILTLINNNILSAAEVSIPLKVIPTNRLPVPWWDDDVKNVIKNSYFCWT